MDKIRKGDIVGRKSYGKDILFIVERVIKSKNQTLAILKGLTLRIEADAPIEDLEIIEKQRVQSNMRTIDNKLAKRISKCPFANSKCFSIFKRSLPGRNKHVIYTGKILHLDGDRKYSEKSARYYKELGLNAIVKNIPENRQASMIMGLLDRYKPDILVITGHDGMIKNGTGYNDIYNYRNSRHFINAVNEARKWDAQKRTGLVIFAGACQSYYEALVAAGANFASSPARVLIDFADPLVIAEKVALTDSHKYISIDDVAEELRDGKSGVGGVGANGKKSILFL